MLNLKFKELENISAYEVFRLVSLLLTLALVVGHNFIPEKRITIHPSAETQTDLYGYVHPVTGASESWLKERSYYWLCNFMDDHLYGCGFSIYKDETFTQGYDLRRFEAVEFDVTYRGPASRIRMYIRNYDDDYATPGDGSSTKYMSMTLRKIELENGPVVIKLNEFNVADWWLKERDVRKRWSASEYANITEVGVDHFQKGIHETAVNRITLVGRWISSETLFTFVIGFWVLLFIGEGFHKFYSVYKKSREGRIVVNILENEQSNLLMEKKDLEVIYKTDPLTSVLNRAGFNEVVESLFSKSDPKIAVLLIDIDFFKSVNDKYGHDVGDHVLKEFASAISFELQDKEVLARWGGEEFVLLVHTSGENGGEEREVVLGRAENIRSVIERSVFGKNENLHLSVSIGVAWAVEGEPFEVVFKRADNALYKAKTGGRNCVKWEL